MFLFGRKENKPGEFLRDLCLVQEPRIVFAPQLIQDTKNDCTISTESKKVLYCGKQVHPIVVCTLDIRVPWVENLVDCAIHEPKAALDPWLKLRHQGGPLPKNKQ